jgi:hypothetical protein
MALVEDRLFIWEVVVEGCLLNSQMVGDVVERGGVCRFSRMRGDGLGAVPVVGTLRPSCKILPNIQILNDTSNFVKSGET